MSKRWQIWIDRGGTFTDCLGLSPRGELTVVKVLSSDSAPIDGIRTLLSLGADEPIPPCDIRMGTTIATNALLERTGVRTALLITRGFGDLLDIGDQTRPDLFDVRIERPSRVYREVVEIDARVDAQGNVLSRPDPESTRKQLAALKRSGIESIAVVVIHAYRNPTLELELVELARTEGFRDVSVSHDVANELGMVARGQTTVVDAYLTPLLATYLRTLSRQLPGSSLRFMQSSGGLTEAARFRGRNAVLSGPAGGAVAVSHVAQTMGHPRVIGFDMGGTSTDVCRYAGELERVYETRVAGVRIRAPMMGIHTVAAGGGSLCRYEGGRFTVGPESAGAEPGPICYGRPNASELALTDINLALGRLLPDRFPFELDTDAVHRALAEVCASLRATGDERTPQQVAEGFFRVAVENMAEAIRRISIARGHDVRNHALVVFGGAGGQHGCALARRLGMRTLLFHPCSGVLSAFGMGVADVSWHGEADARRHPVDDGGLEDLVPRFTELEEAARATLGAEGFRGDAIRVTRRVDLRYRGTETALTLLADDPRGLQAAFADDHRREFGYSRPDHPIEAVTLRVEALGVASDPGPMSSNATATTRRASRERTKLWHDGSWQEATVVQREHLSPGQPLTGPALVLEATGTIVVDPGWTLEIDNERRIVLQDQSEAHAPQASTALDPVLLEIFHGRFQSIAEQMGTVLRRTALSTNIRERLDFSCALFDASGGLVANAPHIPVHLGAMSESVRAVVREHGEPGPGDVFVTNDPSAGGSHLPDVTVVTPVHRGRRLVFFTASRGHHADIGGKTPGSMPPDSHTLEDEGVVLRALNIVRNGVFDRERVLEALRSARYPARNPAENLADLEAQIAANRTGERLLLELVEHYGLEVVEAYMGHVQDNAAARVAEAIADLSDGVYAREDAMDEGATIRVRLEVDGNRMSIDFTGSSSQVQDNLNAPRAVTVAAVLYVLRTMVGRPIPLNSGCLRPVDLRIPPGSLLDPAPGAAVAAGNVETSQRIVDVLLGAIGRVAASQGTMNNLTFGTDEFGYYETIGGGAGAGDGFEGASGVHTHMTNTKITDPEVLEARFPVRLLEFSLRRGSGGAGKFRGGDGLIREIEFLEPMKVSMLSQRRTEAPFGLAGGEPGARGRNVVAGSERPGRFATAVARGDRVRIETPGGGGFGKSA